MHEPFWMLVACVLVNRATWEVAAPILRQLVRDIGGPGAFFGIRAYLRRTLRPLGFQNVRTDRLLGLADAWRRSRPYRSDDVLKLPGCGKYAADSWAIFVEGRLDVQPSDGKLLWYLQQLRGMR